MKTVLITQARTGSTRLPGKVMKEVNGKPLLKIHLERLSRCRNVSEIIVATTTESRDEIIYNLAKKWGFQSYRGSEQDVLDRYYQAAKPFQPDWVVRVTSDCPLLDSVLVDDVIEFAQSHNFDYVSSHLSNSNIGMYPNGQNVEVFPFSALEQAWTEAEKDYEREHVTQFIINHSDHRGGERYRAKGYPCENDYSHIRMTVDHPEDFELIEILIDELGDDKTWIEYTEHMISNDLVSINSHHN